MCNELGVYAVICKICTVAAIVGAFFLPTRGVALETEKVMSIFW